MIEYVVLGYHSSFSYSLDDYVKSELFSSQENNEMIDFMRSAFQKIAEINNKKPIVDEKEKMENNMTAILDSMDTKIDTPFAKLDAANLYKVNQ